MQDFIDYLEKDNIIGKLRQFYNFGSNEQNNSNSLNHIIKSLESLNSSSGELIENSDVLISVYEQLRNHQEKKKYGEFYTPISVVKYILDGIGYNSHEQIETKKIMDISCGSGSFIIQAVRELIKRSLKTYSRKKISELTVEEAKEIISTIKANIFGIDINPIACILCQTNIYFTLFGILKHILSFEPDYHLPWFNIRNFNALKLKSEQKYDFVVGNPPYLFIRDIPSDQRSIIEMSKFDTNDGQYDYYQIFIELGIKILKQKGMLGYIVPDSLLALSNRSILRKFIYDNTKIREIYHTGPKFSDPIVSNIIIILEKEHKISERKNNLIKLKLADEPEENLPQNVIENWNYKFLIHLNQADISILDQLNSGFPKLKDLPDNYNVKLILGRGVELSKTGKVIYCETCAKYLPIPQKKYKCDVCDSYLKEENSENIIYDEIPTNEKQERFQLFLYSINRYQITQYKYIDTSKQGINYKDLNLYKDRIIIRQISQNGKICATYDKNLSLTSQSFYNLSIKNSPIFEFNNFYVLGLFNSMLFSYFFIKSFGTYKKLFPRILIEKIYDFPIKVPISKKEKEDAKKIIETVKLILEYSTELKPLQTTIDFLVFKLYQISENNQKYIMSYMKTLNS
ncbi:MAG: Eco57I restriction-modification methylase domain-containing protein [Candidatus Hermodarchaeota archaeon]